MGSGVLPTVQGFGGLSFTAQAPGERSYGYSNASARSVRDTAGAIFQGSQDAQGEMQRAYEGLFLTRALGSRNAFQQNETRLGGEQFASGMSPELTRLGRFSRESKLQSDIGGAEADSESQLHLGLAELYKNTGSEIANLDMTQAGWLQQALLAKKQRKASETAGWMGLAGSALGAAGAAAGKH